MAMREEFDKYLLLKKLSEDPLGETFRAGRMGSGSLDQVVLLRVLNGPRLDGQALARELPGRAAVQQALKSPNIGNGVEVGVFRGVPFLAYDYISGRNLAALVQQAQRQTSPIAVDHALLIAERIALALAVAHETRADGERLSHGFLVPHLVMISNEGETRVLGFEVGPLLAQQARGGTFEPEVSSYLAPEVIAGQDAARSDDVYSLGAILFELLTGERPSGDAAARAAMIERTTAADGEPLPAPLTDLLKKSLAPRDHRIGDPVTWHKALSKLMTDGRHSATTFNLAFFMHNLFRADIERESQEMEAEKKIQPPVAVGPDRPASTIAVPREEVEQALAGAGTGKAAGPGDATGTGVRPVSEPKRGKGGLIAVAAVVLLAAVGGGAWWFLLGPGSGTGGENAAAQQAAAQLPPSPIPDEPQGPTPEEIQAQIQTMIEARSQEMEDKLQSQYDERIQQLQTQLSDAQEQARQRELARQREVDRLEAERLEQERLAAEEAAKEAEPPPEPEPEVVAAETQLAQLQSDGTAGPELSRPEPAVEQQRRPEPPPEPEPAVVKPPELIAQPDPRYPPLARRVGKQATVILRVLVDERGNVAQVDQISRKAGFGIDQAALEAAKDAKYRPGSEDGKPKEMWTTIRFTFRP